MFIFGLAAFLASLPVLAITQVTTSVHDIDYGQKPGDEILVLLTSGQVAKLPPGKSLILNRLKEEKVKGMNLRLTLDDERYIINMESSEEPVISPVRTKNQQNPDFTYIPTTLPSMDVAKKYLREGRNTHKPETQCFNRAMVWTYEWWKAHSLKSMKILIYWSRTYIRRYNFEWWFHIAPYVHVMDENGKVVERVMDLKYIKRPVPFKTWTDFFTHKDPDCKVITKYSDYADYPYSGECYLQRTNMYTYQPADLQMNEAWGYTKERFNMTEVRGAYLEAFDERI